MTTADPVWVCVLCRRETVLDDAMVPTASGRCTCLGCWHRNLDDTPKPTPKDIEREVNREDGT